MDCHLFNQPCAVAHAFYSIRIRAAAIKLTDKLFDSKILLKYFHNCHPSHIIYNQGEPFVGKAIQCS